MSYYTFDDGILNVYTMENVAAAGKKPLYNLVLNCSYYYRFENIGVVRYYESLKANAKVDVLVSIPDWGGDIGTNDICILDSSDGGKQYKIDFIQPTYTDDGLKIRKLSLIRLGENYVISN